MNSLTKAPQANKCTFQGNANVMSQRVKYVGVSECVRQDFFFSFYYVAYTAYRAYRNLWSGRSVLKLRVTTRTNAPTVRTQIILHSRCT